jgi:hypothetical protein
MSNKSLGIPHRVLGISVSHKGSDFGVCLFQIDPNLSHNQEDFRFCLVIKRLMML